MSAPAFEGALKQSDSGLRGYDGNQGAKFSVSQNEVAAFAGFLNDSLQEDASVADLLPLPRDDVQAFVDAFRDGRLLTALVNLARPGAVETAVYANTKAASRQHATRLYESLNRAIAGCRKVPGVKLMNVGANDFLDGKPTIVLGVVWQLIFARMLELTSLRHHPETIRLLNVDESLDDFYARPREETLLRWFNFHLESAGSDRRVKNFTSDLRDGRAYGELLLRLDETGACGVAELLKGYDDSPEAVASRVIAAARAIGVDEVLTLPRDIVKGAAKINIVFVAQIFNARPHLRALTTGEEAALLVAAESSGNDSMLEDLRAYSLQREMSSQSSAANDAARSGGGSRSSSGVAVAGGGSSRGGGGAVGSKFAGGLGPHDGRRDDGLDVEEVEEEGMIYEISDDEEEGETIPRCLLCGMTCQNGLFGRRSRSNSNGSDTAPRARKGDDETAMVGADELLEPTGAVPVQLTGVTATRRVNGSSAGRSIAQEQQRRQQAGSKDTDVCVVS